MSEELLRLAEQLDEVAGREARSRLAFTQDILALEARIAAATAEIEQLRRSVAEREAVLLERDTVMHERNLEIIRLRHELGSAYADLEAFTWMLGDAVPAMGPLAPDLPGTEFVYYLHTPPFRLYRGDRFTLRGWLFPKDGTGVKSVRVRVDEDEFFGRGGIEEPGAVAQHGLQPRNPRPGFEIEFLTKPGRHRLRLEACLDGRGWFSVLCLPIWCRPEA